MAAARVVAAALMLSGVAFSDEEMPTTNLTMFKRTHASCGAFGDADFVENKLGMGVSVNVSYYCNGIPSSKPCSRRVVVRAPRRRSRLGRSAARTNERSRPRPWEYS